MAFVSGGFYSSVTLMDNGTNTTVQSYELDAADATEAAVNHAAVIVALNNVTDAEIISHFWYEKMIEDTPVIPGSGVQIENMALLSFDILGNPLKTATRTIPAPKSTVFTSGIGAGANVVDTAAANVVAFRSLFQNAGGCFISDGEKANTLKGGKRIHRASRKG